VTVLLGTDIGNHRLIQMFDVLDEPQNRMPIDDDRKLVDIVVGQIPFL
jgi:hypothetical protein